MIPGVNNTMWETDDGKLTVSLPPGKVVPTWSIIAAAALVFLAGFCVGTFFTILSLLNG